MKVQSRSEVKRLPLQKEAANWALQHRSASLFSLPLLLFFSGISLWRGSKANHSVWVMSRLFAGSFPTPQKYCKMFYIVITLGWHFQTPMTELLFHVILISTGTCANLTSSKEWFKPNMLPALTKFPQKSCQETLAHISSYVKPLSHCQPCPSPSWAHSLT